MWVKGCLRKRSDWSSRRIADFENADIGHISVTDATGSNDGGYSSLFSYFFGRNNRDTPSRSKNQIIPPILFVCGDTDQLLKNLNQKHLSYILYEIRGSQPIPFLERMGPLIRDAVRRRSDQSQSTLGSEFLGRKKRAYNIDGDYVAKRAPGSEFLGKRMLGRQVTMSESQKSVYTYI